MGAYRYVYVGDGRCSETNDNLQGKPQLWAWLTWVIKIESEKIKLCNNLIDFHFQLLEHSFFLIVQYAKSTSLPPHPRGSSGPTYVSDTSAAFSSAQETMQLQKNEHKEFREIKKNITI